VTPPKPGLREPIATFFAATALACALSWLARVIPFLQENLSGALAVIFLYAPALAARLSRRPFDYRTAGLTFQPLGLNARVAGTAILLTWPLFFALFLGFYGYVCRPEGPAFVRDFAERFAPMCWRWLGLGGAHLQVAPKFAQLALAQVVVVAVPEELFFRGYLMDRLEERWPSTRLFLGARVGWPLLVSSALFAVGHLLVIPEAQRLAVFFPALVFGWMRARTGSIAPGALFHALCNLLMGVLLDSFFGT
jgi:hypothetical protein